MELVGLSDVKVKEELMNVEGCTMGVDNHSSW
jgi:hypothetical protein